MKRAEKLKIGFPTCATETVFMFSFYKKEKFIEYYNTVIG